MSKRIVLKILFIVVIANFAAQVPYYFHQYYLPYRTLPSLTALFLMTFVLGWFLSGVYLLYQEKTVGYYLSISFLAVEFLFYLQTQIVQAVTGRGVLLHLLHPDGATLFIVFGIGYVNMLASPWFAYHFIKNKSKYLG